MAVAVGENAIPLVAVPIEAAQVYVFAPLPVKVTDWPKQTADVLEAAATTGRVFTVIAMVETLELKQPTLLVPVTE